jgi:hypothetical protein
MFVKLLPQRYKLSFRAFRNIEGGSGPPGGPQGPNGPGMQQQVGQGQPPM